MSGRDARHLAALAALGLTTAAAGALLYLFAVRTAAGQELDVLLFAYAQHHNDVLEAPAGLLRRALPLVLLMGYVVAAAVGVVAGRWRRVVAGLLLVASATVLSRWLRFDGLERPYLGDHGYTENTFPSGHVAVTLSLALALAFLLLPRVRRTAIWAVSGIAVVACIASVVGHAHRPADVLGSVLLVVSLSCFAALAASPRTRQRR